MICEELGRPKFQKDEHRQSGGMSNAEYYPAAKGESWKLELMRVIDECMRYAGSREEFLALLRAEGYTANWSPTRKNIKSHCSSHRIHEEVLDQAVWNYAEELRKRYAAELKKVTQLQKQWALRKPSLDARCLTLQKEILKLEHEIDELVMEKLKGDVDASVHEISI